MRTLSAGEDKRGEPVTKNIWHCPDGAYRWTYEFDMLKNPTILITVYKMLGISFGAVYLFMLLVELIGGDLESWTAVWRLTRPFVILAGVFLVIGLLAYLIVAAMYGGKYQVLFEMTDEYVRHIQMPKQFKKAEALGWLISFAGAATGKPSVHGMGANIAAKSASASVFKNVEFIKVRRKRHTIHVGGMLDRNQVYAEDADFDYVEKFIEARCEKAKIRRS